MKTSSEKTRRLVTLALLSALVIVMQTIATLFPGVTPVNLTLVPIVVGAILCGVSGGAILGFLFAVVVIVAGFTGTDVFTFTLLSISPAWTVVICLVKGIGCGAAAGAVYKLLESKNRFLACLFAAMIAPVVNTGVFTLGMLTVVRGAFEQIAETYAVGNAVQWLFTGILGVNFVIEFLSNSVLSSAISYITKHAKKH